MPKKLFVSILWVEGILAIAYGMMQQNDFAFIVGIISVTIGYLMFRKDLKRIGEKPTTNEPDTPASPDEE
ncbi:hypothetical protein ACFL6W_04505 [Thermodesulfobacteriota bacterium]